MSNDHINWAKKQQISPVQKLLLFILADHSDIYGHCYPSIRLLSEETCLSRSSIFRAMVELSDLKLIIRTTQTRHNGSITSNLYKMDTSVLVTKEGTKEFNWGDAAPISNLELSTGQSHSETPPCQADTPLVSQRHPPRVTVRYPESSSEPSYESNIFSVSDETTKKEEDWSVAEEEDEEQLDDPSVFNLPHEPPQRAAKKKKHRLPDDWAHNERHESLATELGLVLGDELENFRDHHNANGNVMLDWSASFRTWLRNAKKFKDKNTYRGNKSSDSNNLNRVNCDSIKIANDNIIYLSEREKFKEWQYKYCLAKKWPWDNGGYFYDKIGKNEKWFMERYKEYLEAV